MTSPALDLDLAVQLIAAQGLAVSVGERTLLPAHRNALGEIYWLPALPEADIRLHRALDVSAAERLPGDHLTLSLKVAA